MDQRMVQKGNVDGTRLQSQYNPSSPGKTEQIMNAVFSGLAKTEQPLLPCYPRVPCASSMRLDDPTKYYQQRFRHTMLIHQQRAIHQPYSAPQPSTAIPHFFTYHPTSYHVPSPPPPLQSSIPSTVFQIQESTREMENISDEQLDETLKDLGLLEPRTPSTSPSAASPNIAPSLASPSTSISSSSSPCSSSGSHSKELQGQPLLYRFIMEILENPDTNPSLIEWVDRSQGMFALVDPNEIARRWGVCKNNPCMNYEKMSRGFRYYYKVGILERVAGKKLVYKFSARAPIWSMLSSSTNEKTTGCG